MNELRESTYMYEYIYIVSYVHIQTYISRKLRTHSHIYVCVLYVHNIHMYV